jgi:crotonobetainyl-CoA:carnitine CoA-transferase CaiB-like acyl-CoA transferase
MFQSDARFASQGARLKHIDEIYEYLSEVFSRRSTQEWIDLLERADIPVARMYSIDGIPGDEYLAAIGYFQKNEHPSEGSITTLAIPTEWSDSRPEALRHAPKLGENAVDVLREAGYTLAAIDAPVEQGAVKVA